MYRSGEVILATAPTGKSRPRNSRESVRSNVLVRSRSPVVALGDGRAEGWVKPTSEMPLHLGIMRQMEREGDSAHTFALRHRVRGCTPGHLVRVQRERRALADRILVTKPYGPRAVQSGRKQRSSRSFVSPGAGRYYWPTTELWPLGHRRRCVCGGRPSRVGRPGRLPGSHAWRAGHPNRRRTGLVRRQLQVHLRSRVCVIGCPLLGCR